MPISPIASTIGEAPVELCILTCTLVAVVCPSFQIGLYVPVSLGSPGMVIKHLGTEEKEIGNVPIL